MSMEAFLDLSLWKGLSVTILVICIPGLIAVFIGRKMTDGHMSKGHEKIGRLLFRVSASLIALLISLSYANEKINYDKVKNSLEQEASLISSVMLKLRVHNTKQAETIRESLMDYVDFTIDDPWVNDHNNPYLTKVMATVERINIMVHGLPTENDRQKILKEEIIRDVGTITRTMQIRFHSNRFHFPFLSYILGFGLLIAWCFYTVYPIDRISMTFLTLYNTFIAILLYFVIMLGNPMVGPLKIDPEPFTILQERNNNIPF